MHNNMKLRKSTAATCTNNNDNNNKNSLLFSRGERCIVNGLRGKFSSKLNGSIVEIIRLPSSKNNHPCHYKVKIIVKNSDCLSYKFSWNCFGIPSRKEPTIVSSPDIAKRSAYCYSNDDNCTTATTADGGHCENENKGTVKNNDKEENDVVFIRQQNLFQLELNWTEEDFCKGLFAYYPSYCTKCKSVTYSKNAMYIFLGGGPSFTTTTRDDYNNGRQEQQDEEEVQNDTSYSLWSYEFKTQRWDCLWLCNYNNENDMSAPGPGYNNNILNKDPNINRGVLLTCKNPLFKRITTTAAAAAALEEDLLLYYTSYIPNEKEKYHYDQNNSTIRTNSIASINIDSIDVDCVWIYHPSRNSSGTWKQIPTAGSKPASFLQGEQLRYHRQQQRTNSGNGDVFPNENNNNTNGYKEWGGYRNCSGSTIVIPDKDGDGLRIVMWSGLYWPPIIMTENDIDRASIEVQENVAMTGLFELHITNAHLFAYSNNNIDDDANITTPSSPPKWRLLKQQNNDSKYNHQPPPTARHKHTLTLVGQDNIVLIGGEPVFGFDETSTHLGDYVYNLQTNEWKRLSFKRPSYTIPYLVQSQQRRHIYAEYISNHLALFVPNRPDAVAERCEELMIAATCCNSNGLIPAGHGQVIWRHVWNYLVSSIYGRILVIRQSHDVYERINTEEKADTAVLMYDLTNMNITPLQTNSSIHNGRFLEKYGSSPAARRQHVVGSLVRRFPSSKNNKFRPFANDVGHNLFGINDDTMPFIGSSGTSVNAALYYDHDLNTSSLLLCGKLSKNKQIRYDHLTGTSVFTTAIH